MSHNNICEGHSGNKYFYRYFDVLSLVESRKSDMLVFLLGSFLLIKEDSFSVQMCMKMQSSAKRHTHVDRLSGWSIMQFAMKNS